MKPLAVFISWAAVLLLLCWKPLHEHLSSEARELRVQDEVDDAGDGVGAIDGRGASGEDVDPLHERRRDEVQIGGRGEGVAGRHPPPVEQRQRADRAQIAQLHRRCARGAVGDRGVLGCEDLRQLLDQVLDAARPLVCDLLDGHDRDGAESRQSLRGIIVPVTVTSSATRSFPSSSLAFPTSGAAGAGAAALVRPALAPALVRPAPVRSAPAPRPVTTGRRATAGPAPQTASTRLNLVQVIGSVPTGPARRMPARPTARAERGRSAARLARPCPGPSWLRSPLGAS